MSKSQYKNESVNSDLRYEYGLIAQDVNEILKKSDPEKSIVLKDDEGFFGMDYKQITMPLIKAVQEQQEMICSQKKTIDDLIMRLEKMEKLILVNR
tara:strand:- start:21 stop:308 length:288 start_codon:yes stop_codon:yes gene_type:complete